VSIIDDFGILLQILHVLVCVDPHACSATRRGELESIYTARVTCWDHQVFVRLHFRAARPGSPSSLIGSQAKKSC